MKNTRNYKSLGKYSWIGGHLQCLHLNPVHSDIQFSCSVESNSLWPHEPQHARPPCPSTPGVHPNSCPLSRWYHRTILSFVMPFPLLPSILPSIRVFSNESALRIRWPKYWSFSFSISPSNEYSGLLVGSPCSPRDSQESSPTPQFKSINSSALSFLHSPTLTSIHDHWKNYSLDQTNLCRQSNLSAF